MDILETRGLLFSISVIISQANQVAPASEMSSSPDAMQMDLAIPWHGDFGTAHAPINDDPASIPQAAKDFFDGYQAVYNFTGHGSINQIDNMPRCREVIKQLTMNLNAKYGPGNWCAVYGGDPYNPKAPDIGAVMEEMARNQAHVIAIQNQKYADYIFERGSRAPSYYFLMAAVIYENDVNFGGYIGQNVHTPTNPVQLVGTTKYVFGGNLIKNITGHVAFGGGNIALQELQAALFHGGLRCMYVPTPVRRIKGSNRGKKKKKKKPAELAIEARLVSSLVSSQGFGVIHTWFQDVGLESLERMWITLKRQEEAPDDIKNELSVHKPSGYLWHEYPDSKILKPIQRKITKMETWERSDIEEAVLYRPTEQDVWTFGITLERLYRIDDKENSFNCQFYLILKLVDGPLYRSNKKPSDAPRLEWPNLLGDLKPDFPTAWKQQLERFVNSSLDEHPNFQEFKFSHSFEGTFLFPARYELRNFPYDFETFPIHIKADQSHKIAFYSTRTHAAKLKFSALDAVLNWYGATFSSDYEPFSFLTYFSAPVMDFLKFLASLFCWFCMKKSDKKDVNPHYFVDCKYGISNALESEEGNVYREIEVKLLCRRSSSYVSWSLLFPCFLLGTSGLLMFWIHPVDAIGERLAYGVTLGLAIIALKLNISEHVPPLPKQTYLDFYTLIASVFVSILCGLVIFARRYCLPHCDAELCKPDLSSFIAGFSPTDNADSNQIGETCECNCETDDILLWASTCVWIVVQGFFWCWYIFQRFKFDLMLAKYGLECKGG